MRLSKYLYIDASGDIRHTSNVETDTPLEAKVCIHLDVEIPDEYFDINKFEAKLLVPPKHSGMGTVSSLTAVEQWLKPEIKIDIKKAKETAKRLQELREEDVPF